MHIVFIGYDAIVYHAMSAIGYDTTDWAFHAIWNYNGFQTKNSNKIELIFYFKRCLAFGSNKCLIEYEMI